MKKILLFVVMMVMSVVLMAQAYSYYPFGGNAYVVPDANFNGLNSLDGLNGDETTTNKQDMGLVWHDFDQVDSDATTFDSDWGNTVGANDGIVSEDGGGGAVRDWTYPEEYDFVYAVAKNNGNPKAPRIGGGWYMYTINFSEVKDYSLIMRVRGFSNEDADDYNMYQVTVHEKSDMENVLHTWDVNLDGIVFDEGIGSLSADKKFQNVAKARFDVSGQATTFWVLNVKEDERFKPDAAGEYVVKVSHLPGETYLPNASCGGVSFYVGDLPEVDTNAQQFESSPIEVEYYRNRLNVSGIAGNAFLNIYNLSGALVMQKNFDGDFSQEINLSKGVYVVTANDDEGRGKTAKIVVR